VSRFPLIPAQAGIQRWVAALAGTSGRGTRTSLTLPAIFICCIAIWMAGAAQAHQVNLSTARVELRPDRSVAVQVALKGSDVDRLAGTQIYDAQKDLADPAKVAASAGPIAAYVSAHVGVARQVVLIGAGENAPQALLDDTHSTLTISAPAPSVWSTMQRYLITGIEHIFLGYDHIAFLVAIVLWARRLVPVIKVVTAFTIAHSITLSLAALQIVVIPSAIVEPAIAASIIFVAVENFFSRNVDGRWKVTFAFGLIHGFGFAGALQEMGLPANAVVPALAAFNIGVEIGQVAIVSIVVPALILLDRLFAADRTKPVRAAALVYTLSAVITVLGSYWLVTRVFES
jgi:hydrogenase/urease accessory protein HupE